MHSLKDIADRPFLGATKRWVGTMHRLSATSRLSDRERIQLQIQIHYKYKYVTNTNTKTITTVLQIQIQMRIRHSVSPNRSIFIFNPKEPVLYTL